MKSIAVVGSRNVDTIPYKDFIIIMNSIMYSLYTMGIMTNEFKFVSGGANGIDTYSMHYCKKFGYSQLIHFPKWNEYGKRAGMIRNKLIVDDSDIVIAFWDYKSKGTENTINTSNRCKKPLIIVSLDDTNKYNINTNNIDSVLGGKIYEEIKIRILRNGSNGSSK